MRPIVDLIATSLEHRRFHASATAVLTEFATRFGCGRASLGFVHGKHARVCAVSHSASFEEKMNMAHAVGAAMDEALDQDASVVYPAKPDHAIQALRAHTELARRSKAGSICTLPINHDGRLVGAITLEHPIVDVFDADTIALCESIAALVGPILDTKYQDERSLPTKCWQRCRQSLEGLFGPEHVAIKLVGVLALAATVFLTFATGDYHVTSAATLEGTVQRVVIAPIDGFIMEAGHRAGDVVEQGDLLCLLDDKDLKLERMRWFSEKQQLQKEYRGALGQHERTQVTILKAKLDQATAKLALSEENLARSRILAPLGGVIVAGDLSQSLGAPVERGDVLFEIAPLDSYRVMLRVDEREIGQIVEQQRGMLALAGFPNERFPFVVSRITPVSTAAEGSNFFIVEAELEETSKLLRPGMQGVGKIEIGERRLGWILTHELSDWVRLWLWT